MSAAAWNWPPELAELTNLSPWYLSKTFQSVYRETVQSAGVRTRLARACRLLVTTVLSISEISELCGFKNCCSFSRLFRVRFGMTASDYRRTAAGSSHNWKVGFETPSAQLAAGNGGRIAMPA
jgi:transcriptional regulator GlxA family with amidase domain